MSVRRGRPPVLAGGISGSSRAHWASVKLLGNPWPDCRCVSRCSLVHMPNHRLPIVVETVNHANLSDARNSWVRLLAGDVKGRSLSHRLECGIGHPHISIAAPVSAETVLDVDGPDGAVRPPVVVVIPDDQHAVTCQYAGVLIDQIDPTADVGSGGAVVGREVGVKIRAVSERKPGGD